MKSFDKKLKFIAGQLNAENRQHLLSYADYLLNQQESADEAKTIAAPVDITPPEDESVVAAMQRMSKTYPMLNKDDLLHEAAGLMSEHVMQGRAATDVINDLQALFLRHYEAYVQNMKGMLNDGD